MENVSENTAQPHLGEESGLPLQTSHVAVEVVLVSGDWTRIGVLPESVVFPSGRQRASAARPMSDPQRVSSSESSVVASARFPPVGGGVNNWVAANAGMVGVGEFADPVDHRSSVQSIATGAAIWVIYPID